MGQDCVSSIGEMYKAVKTSLGGGRVRRGHATSLSVTTPVERIRHRKDLEMKASDGRFDAHLL